jgi:hypothetical protein
MIADDPSFRPGSLERTITIPAVPFSPVNDWIVLLSCSEAAFFPNHRMNFIRRLSLV